MSNLSSSSPVPRVMRQYPWIIAVSGLLTLIIINGLTTSSLSVFDEALVQEFKLNRGLLKSRETVTYAVAAAFILLSGILIDRIGVKKLLLSGLGIMTMALAGYKYAKTLNHLYILHVLLGFAYVTAGPVPMVILVSGWFQEKRGLALGITLAGTSLGSAIFPPLLTHLMTAIGWRNTFYYLAFIPFIVLIYAALVVRNGPANETSKPVQSGMSYQAALRTPLFWVISFCGFLSFLGIVGIVSNLFLHLRELNFTSTQAAWMLSLYFILALVGKLVFSTLSDYYNIYRIFTTCFIGLALGSLGLGSLERWAVFPSITMAALSWGGVFTLYNVLIVKSFGLREAGKINGTINLFESCGSLLGPIVVGVLSEKLGSYQGPLYGVACVFGLTTILTFFLARSVNIKKTY
ncbi:MAG: MFS transporter [Siphonobacter sp.]